MKIRDLEETLKSVNINCAKCEEQICNYLIGDCPFHSPPQLLTCSCCGVVTGIVILPANLKFEHEDIFTETQICFNNRILVGEFGNAEKKTKIRVSMKKYLQATK